MRTIQSNWEQYKAKVLPADAPEIQIKECKLAFYSGALSSTAVMTSCLDPAVSPEAADAILDGMQEDIALFFKNTMDEARKKA